MAIVEAVDEFQKNCKIYCICHGFRHRMFCLHWSHMIETNNITNNFNVFQSKCFFAPVFGGEVPRHCYRYIRLLFE